MNDASRADNRIRADARTFKNNHIIGKPAIRANYHRLRFVPLILNQRVRVSKSVVMIVYFDSFCKHTVIADHNAIPTNNRAVVVEEAAFPDIDFTGRFDNEAESPAYAWKAVHL